MGSALPLRDELRGLSPYGAPMVDVPVRLNVNENPYPPSEAMVAYAAIAVGDVLRGLNRYPDRDATALRRDLASYLGHGLDASRVWAANGSNEVMLQLLQAFGGPGRTALSFAPTYSMYPEYARNTATTWVTGRRESDFSVDRTHALAQVRQHQPSIVLLASPNNPTGTALPLDIVAALHDACAGIVVVDEAYAEFRRAGTPSAISLLADYPRLVVVRTMSKAFAFAGARLGYLAAAPDIVSAVQVVRLPYHLSSVTQAVARVALAHAHELLAKVEAIRLDRDEIAEWLRGQGLTVPESDANFVLFGVFDDRHAIWQGLLDHGVLVRETGPEGFLRVTVGTPEEMAVFRDAMVEVLK
ncbi:MAG TPA: histidinol-phosphate transaminase [Jiangellaceae bacterium]